MEGDEFFIRGGGDREGVPLPVRHRRAVDLSILALLVVLQGAALGDTNGHHFVGHEGRIDEVDVASLEVQAIHPLDEINSSGDCQPFPIVRT